MLIKAQSQLKSARRRATALRKRYNQPPIVRIASIASGGAISALVTQYSPIQTVATIPISAVTGVAMVAGGAFMKGTQSEMLINIGSGMLACGLQDFTKNQLSAMGETCQENSNQKAVDVTKHKAKHNL